MVLESTVICVDNSDYTRNGDFIPSRLQAQQEAVNLLCNAKRRSNPENNVGLVTMANNCEVLTTLTTDVGKVMAKLQQVQPNGEINFITGVRIAHLALRHRQGRNHRMRIVIFVGSPLKSTAKELTQLAKKLKKEKVSVDIVNFGEEQEGNNDLLQSFIEELRGKDGSGSHLATLVGGCDLADSLARSPIVKGEDGDGAGGSSAAGGGSGGGFEFGIDPNDDPELAMALRISMEEQRNQQEREARAAGAQAQGSAEGRPPASTDEEDMLVQALTGGVGGSGGGSSGGFVDFGSMSEEDQIAYAIQMSMQEAQRESQAEEEKKGEKEKKDKKGDEKREGAGAETMEVDQEGGETEDFTAVVQDAAFLESVLQTLPGVDPQSVDVRSAVESVAKEEEKGGEKKEDEDKK